jgi:hypothetical protein
MVVLALLLFLANMALSRLAPIRDPSRPTPANGETL